MEIWNYSNSEFKNLRIKVKNNKHMQWTPEKVKEKSLKKKLQDIKMIIRDNEQRQGNN